MKKLLLVLALLTLSLTASAQSADESAIRKVMDDQVAAWNHGDLATFMIGYEDSPQTTFVGNTNTYGYQTILDRYKKSFATKDEMGTLTFSQVEIHLLPASDGKVEYAMLYGHFHLDRTTHGVSKKDDGYYSLIFHKTKDGWKIIVDHTS
jgi:ketosteroid isomerase-like protein